MTWIFIDITRDPVKVLMAGKDVVKQCGSTSTRTVNDNCVFKFLAHGQNEYSVIPLKSWLVIQRLRLELFVLYRLHLWTDQVICS